MTHTATDFKALGERLRNWERWGADDRLGTLNFVTPERVAAAARLARTGRVFDLGIPFNAAGPGGHGGRPNAIHSMTVVGGVDMGSGASFCDDHISMHLQCATHWDALSHFFYDGTMYNGHGLDEVTAEGGATALGIEHVVTHTVGRGVLLDIAGLHGVDWLEITHAITPDELEQAAHDQGVEIGSGDILCVRTGWRRKLLEEGPSTEWSSGNPGIGIRTPEWLHEKEIAAVASDNWGVEVLPGETPDTFAPLHCILLRDMGLILGEMFDFESLVADCRQDGQWDFLLAGTPLKVTGAVGAPLTPVAVK